MQKTIIPKKIKSLKKRPTEANNMASVLLANKKSIQLLLNERKPFNYLCKSSGISNHAMCICLFNLFYFQTAKQVFEEGKQVKNIFILSSNNKKSPTIFIKIIN
ncbi:hypothetical protein [Leuconostoc lactis]|uniref:hypothetical protein n=1 Tax=Leuconostoc lactis TaxID=1246 RepID=UPI001F3F1EBF|nr:hypothetical protein [Leuconostoc lactis]